MGFSDREPPFFFAKPADAVTPDGADVPYPPRTGNLHHEIELVLAIGKGAPNIPVEQALDHIFGYAVGNDLTRRDLQAQAREAGKPWDTAKGFDASAPVSAIHPASVMATRGAIWLKVNGEARQSGDTPTSSGRCRRLSPNCRRCSRSPPAISSSPARRPASAR